MLCGRVTESLRGCQTEVEEKAKGCPKTPGSLASLLPALRNTFLQQRGRPQVTQCKVTRTLLHQTTSYHLLPYQKHAKLLITSQSQSLHDRQIKLLPDDHIGVPRSSFAMQGHQSGS